MTTPHDTGFANTKRIKWKPFKKRVYDNLIERDCSGNVCEWFGYYSAGQIFNRKLWGKKLMKAIMDSISVGELY